MRLSLVLFTTFLFSISLPTAYLPSYLPTQLPTCPATYLPTCLPGGRLGVVTLTAITIIRIIRISIITTCGSGNFTSQARAVLRTVKFYCTLRVDFVVWGRQTYACLQCLAQAPNPRERILAIRLVGNKVRSAPVIIATPTITKDY